MKTDLNSSLSSYFNEDLENPKYLYLGASTEIDFEKLKIRNAHNKNFSMRLTSHYNSAVADAFTLKIAEKNVGRDYMIDVKNDRIPILIAQDIIEPDNYEEGLLYIFECPDDAIDEGECYFRVKRPLIPVKVKTLVYRDHKGYFKINPNKQKIKTL